MSSFIVEPICINRIVTWLDTAGKRSIYSSNVQRLLDKYGLVLEELEDLDRLVNSLNRLNREAVNDRYKEQEAVQLFKYNASFAKDIQVLKSLQCLHYQCSEGDVVKTLLYKFLEELEQIIKSKIIDELPEYKAASWSS